MTWRVAESLETLLGEVNDAAPNRSKVSDGSIGDPAHSSRESDHNPNPAGVVRARDFTHDPAGGLDAGKLAEAVRELGIAGHPALGSGAYVIWNRRIASATQDGAPWDWEPYTGSNPHDHHCHVSVSTAASGYDSTRPWGVLDERDWFDMAERSDLREVVDNALAPVLRKLDRAADRDKAFRAAVREEFAGLADEVDDADVKALIRRRADRLERVLGPDDDTEGS